MKRLSKLLIMMLVLLLPLPLVASDSERFIDNYLPVTIHVNGSYLPLDTDPIILEGRTLIPFRAAAEALGADVTWHQASQQVEIRAGDTTLMYTVNHNTYEKNGHTQMMDVPLQLQHNRVLLPIRAFAEALNASVDWEPDLRDVRIQADISAPPQPLPTLPFEHDVVQFFVKKLYVANTPTPIDGSYYFTDQSLEITRHFLCFISTAHGADGPIHNIYYLYYHPANQFTDQYAAMAYRGTLTYNDTTQIYETVLQDPAYISATGGVGGFVPVTYQFRMVENDLQLISTIPFNDPAETTAHMEIYTRF